MQAGGEERHRNSALRVVEMVAALIDLEWVVEFIPASVDGERNRGGGVHRVDDLSELPRLPGRSGSRPDHEYPVSAVTTDHVGVQLRDDRIQRHRRMGR